MQSMFIDCIVIYIYRPPAGVAGLPCVWQSGIHQSCAL